MSFDLKTTLPFLSLLLLTTTNTQAQDDLIRWSCQRTPDPATCESTLRQDPRSAGKNSAGLALIMIDTVKAKFTDSIGIVNRLIKEASDDDQGTKMIKALRRCEHLYNVVLTADVPVAKEAVELGNPKFGVDSMTDSGIEAASCERELTAAASRSPLTERNKYLHGISNVAAALIRILE